MSGISSQTNVFTAQQRQQQHHHQHEHNQHEHDQHEHDQHEHHHHRHQRGWQPEQSLSVPEAIREAMDENAPPQGDIKLEDMELGDMKLRDFAPHEPHLPLRKSSVAQRMQSRKGSIPVPIFAPPQHQVHQGLGLHNPHQVRGFNPSPVQPAPHVTNLQASSEHAFAGREPKRAFQPAMGALENQQSVLPCVEPHVQSPVDSASYTRFRPPSSPFASPTLSHELSPTKRSKSLKHSKSMGDGLRNIRNRISGKHRNGEKRGRLTPDSVNCHGQSVVPGDEIRDSCPSALTSHSSFGHVSSVLTIQTTHTSLSSNSESVKARREDHDEGGLTDIDMSVEDVLGMYENGFDSGPGSARPSPRPSLQSAKRSSIDLRSVRSLRSAEVATVKPGFDARSRRSLDRPASAQTETLLKRPKAAHRRSQSASILIRASMRPPSPSPVRKPALEERYTQDSEDFFAGHTGQILQQTKQAAPQPSVRLEVAQRDRYGFKKASHHITAEQYNAWDAHYSGYLERRKAKWDALMKQFGYETNPALRFPAKSEKVKRYVRKGIPPEYRGAAWFWYAGGPKQLAKEPELYSQLLERVANGELTDNDREHIERDLHRTFPDNNKFKPDPAIKYDVQAGAGAGSAHNIIPIIIETASDASPESKKSRYTRDPETPMVQSLRRVLQTFAVHKPSIGYCQSLNFIAGLLLLFLDGNEHKAFILLNIITDIHLPGTHGTTLEGANIDIGVLMSCIRDSLPAVWSKLDDKKDTLAIGAATTVAGGVGGLRLPTVSLATTAWFMSLFVGTLPIESVLRVWDCLFFEGSKTLFRIAMAIFKAGESQILKVSDPMEIFQVVQTIPRSMLDCNALLEVCFRRRGGFGSVSQGTIEKRRAERRTTAKNYSGTARLDDGNAFRRMKSRMRRTATRAGT